MSLHVFDDTASSVEWTRRRVHRPGILQRMLVLLLCAVLIFAVLAFGSVDDWSTFSFEAGVTALFLLWTAQQVVSGQIKLSRNPLYLPTFLFLALILAQIALRQSAYGYVTKREALQYVSYGIVFLVAAECVLEEQARRLFAQTMSAFGAVYALFALVQELHSNGKIFWFHSPQLSGAMIYGSYVNSNHYAGLMEMLVPIPFVLAVGHLLEGGKRILAGFGATLMASTIFLSRSRGGMIAFVFEMAVFAALILGKRRSPRSAFGLLAVCMSILALLVSLGKGQVLGRFGELNPGIRLDITKDCFTMFAHRPLWGWGLGTFPTIYPSYRSFYSNLFINQAHNDYAQLLVESGLLGFGLMLWFLVRLFQHGLPTSRRWEFKWDSALSLAALLGCTGMLFHSFVDFNLQIPANAALFYVLCALAASRLPSRSTQSRPSQSTETEETRERPHLTEI